MEPLDPLEHLGHVGVILLDMACEIVKIDHTETALTPVQLDECQGHFRTQGQLVKTCYTDPLTPAKAGLASPGPAAMRGLRLL